MLVKMIDVIDGLVVYKDKMKQNLEISRGIVFSQGLLLKLVKKGLTREQAYALVQGCAKSVWEDPNTTLAKEALKSKDLAKHLKETEIKEAFDYQYHLKNVDKIFKRVGL